MSIHIGIDLGAVGLKAALLMPRAQAEALFDAGRTWESLRALDVPPDRDRAVFVIAPRRTQGRPLEATRRLLADLFEHLEPDLIAGIGLTGSGGQLVADALSRPRFNEFQAATRAVDLLCPQVRTVFEIGGETSKYLRLEPDPADGTLGILDYANNGDCAAGTGAFLDQQAGRLQYTVEAIGDIVAGADRAAQIAGRCSVFAKSDMIHAQQKGFSPPEVLRGLCNAVATNYRSAVVRGRKPLAPIALLGGVSANSAVVRALGEAFELRDGDLIVPGAAESYGAIGAAVLASGGYGCQADAVTGGHGDAAECGGAHTPLPASPRLRVSASAPAPEEATAPAFPTSPPLSLDRVTLLRDRVKPYDFGSNGSTIDAYLALDIGSVGTKLVAIDDDGDVIHSIFTRTDGRPIEVVSRIMKELEAAVGDRIRICGVATTGSGRELIGELVGADAINDEITAHKTGATFVGDRLLGRRPDTIFEIGGQDSKYISLEPEDTSDATGGQPADSIVVDFTMNEACAAGTGSFLEERAEELGVSIKGEFAELALSSRAPIKLGERCTVFMERDVNTCMQQGAKREDVIAGLAYSVGYNYINRVVRGRRIGDCIFFQGGTAYNDAVAAAFAAITGKQIIVPPHNAVLGAIGAALLAMERISATGVETRFRGYHIEAVDYTLREFTCNGCGNSCSVQQFQVEGEKTFWGDKCSDRFRKRAKTDRKPIIPDLVALRHKLLHAGDAGDPPGATVCIGIPMAMYTLDYLPMWRRFFHDCGFKVVLSPETNHKIVLAGLDAVVAEPCFPVIVAHGHVANLVDQGVDYIWLPNMMSAETKFLDNESHVCPWGQTLPFVIRQAPPFKAWAGRILCPTLAPRVSLEDMRKPLVAAASDLGVSRRVANAAFDAAVTEQQAFRDAYIAAGREALATLDTAGESGMVLVGRPYNIHDAGISLSVARKLRDTYGVNILPVDALPVADVDIRDVNDNMFWVYGQKILAAARIAAQHADLHLIYVTNFKCGPDSFIKSFIRPASGKPFLSLQFDGHANDAAMLTRCAAYLDTQGTLRWWTQPGRHPREEAFPAEPSISRKCRAPAHV